MKPAQLAALLQECYRERLAMVERHKAVATHVSSYDANNTYQYIVNREETHLSWLADALVDHDAPLPGDPPRPVVTVERGKDAWRGLAAEDARSGKDFCEKWAPRVETLSDARNRTMLQLMLGEVREQTRLFEQAAGGQDDLLGRKDARSATRGVVGIARWIGD